MRNDLLDILTRARATNLVTPEALLHCALTGGNRSHDLSARKLHAGHVILEPVEPGTDTCRVDHFGSTASGLYCISVWEPNGDDGFPADHSAVRAYHVPLTAAEPEGVETLFQFIIHEDRLGRDVWAQANRVRTAGPLLAGVLPDLLRINIEVAQSAVAAHAAGAWHGVPTAARLEITEEVRALLATRARPRVQILREGWFSASESWVASEFGGTAVVIGQEVSFSGAGFVSHSGVTLEPDDLPAAVEDAMQDVWFEPLEPEDADAFFARYDAGREASGEAVKQARANLATWAGVRSVDVPNATGNYPQ